MAFAWRGSSIGEDIHHGLKWWMTLLLTENPSEKRLKALEDFLALAGKGYSAIAKLPCGWPKFAWPQEDLRRTYAFSWSRNVWKIWIAKRGRYCPFIS